MTSPRPARSRRPSQADADHQEKVAERREALAESIVGDPQDKNSPRLLARKAHRARLPVAKLYSRPKAARPLTENDLDNVADDAPAEFDALALAEPTADMLEETE